MLPKALYRVRLDDGRLLRCRMATALRQHTVRVIGGDRVLIHISRFDPHRGEIDEKL